MATALAPETAAAARPFDPEAELGPSGGSGAAAPAPVASDSQGGMLQEAKKHKERGDYAQARRALEDLIRTNPLQAEAHYNLAWVCIELGDRAAALAEFTAAVNLTDPDSDLHAEAQAALQRMIE